jgi:hypothetical protein
MRTRTKQAVPALLVVAVLAVGGCGRSASPSRTAAQSGDTTTIPAAVTTAVTNPAATPIADASAAEADLQSVDQSLSDLDTSMADLDSSLSSDEGDPTK